MTGLLVRPQDGDGLTEALSSLLEWGGRPQRKRMILAGHRHVKEKFTLKQQVESLEALYLRLGTPRPAANLPGG